MIDAVSNSADIDATAPPMLSPCTGIAVSILLLLVSRALPSFRKGASQPLVSSSLQPALDDNDGEEEASPHYPLPPGRDGALEIEEIENDTQQQDTDERRSCSTNPPGEQRATHDHRGDGVEFPS